MTQLSLFDTSTNEDNRPLPFIVADKWNFQLQHHEQSNETWYAVQDWIAGLASCSAKEAGTLWRKMKSKIVISIHELGYIASDNKTYQMAYTNDNGLYQIAAHMRTTTQRPVLAEIKEYLAKAGVFVDKQRLDPEIGVSAALGKYERQGKDPTWIEARVRGIWARNEFTKALQDSIQACPSYIFASATEAVHLHLLERTTKQLRGDLRINQHQNPRDHMGKFALLYLGLTEGIIAEKLQDMDMVTETVGIEIIRSVASMIHTQYQQTQNALGYDLVTEKKLLEG